jgi:hypothetical protein
LPASAHEPLVTFHVLWAWATDASSASETVTAQATVQRA